MKNVFYTSRFKAIAICLAWPGLLTGGFGQTTHQVTLTNNSFTPSQVNIRVGDTVVWTNTQGDHNVNGTRASYPSNPESFGNIVGSGWTFTHVFHHPGTYNYHCNLHVDFGMIGKVIVSDKANIKINFSDMTPHIGQDFWLALIEDQSGDIIARMQDTVEESFSMILSDLIIGRSYHIDFFSDHNQNGYYDPPSADHAWRLEVPDLSGDTTISFVHNTDFTDIAWVHTLSIHFHSMDPHDGQDMWLNVVERDTDREIARVKTVVVPEFILALPGIEPGKDYRISFFADHNGNGKYDAPPVDHAWKLDLDEVSGDTALSFIHNTDFEDIEWENRLKIRFTGMSPHVGQFFRLYLYDLTDAVYADTITINQIPGEDFDVESEKIMYGHSYHIDFFADMSGNGSYNPPPADHAWRIHLTDSKGDTTILFVHNTDFTDISEQHTPLKPASELNTLQVYPNPAGEFITLSGDELPAGEIQVRILNTNGQLVKLINLRHSNVPLTLQITDLKKGAYYLLIQSGGYRANGVLLKTE